MNGLSEKDLFEGLSNTSDSVYLFENDLKENYSIWSDNAVRYFGLPDDYSTRTLEVWLPHVHPDDRKDYMDDLNMVFSGQKSRHYCQYRVKNAEGDYVWVECIGNMIPDEKGNPAYFVGMITRLDHQNKYDSVTKCPYLQQFYQSETTSDCTLLLIGMDGFRRLISLYGYEAGNRVLLGLTTLIKRTAPQATIYRMAGDELLILLPDSTPEKTELFFHHLLSAFQKASILDGQWQKLSFSGGAIHYQPACLTKELALRQLEHSLEHAKNLGSGSFSCFCPEIEEKHARTQKIKNALFRAIEQDFQGFQLFFQPIMSHHGEDIYGVEALLRFFTPELGIVSPAEFIPLLEETRDIRVVGTWVMEQAIRQKSLWMERHPHWTVTFNVSYLQLYNNDFIERLIEVTNQYQVDPHYIAVELTESCRILYPESLSSMLGLLKDYGFQVLLDDFGMEYSSFTLVRDLPVSGVKIDHSFVRSLTNSEEKRNQVNLAIISSINYMCRQLGLNVIAEGIENLTIEQMLGKMEIDYLQGYHYSLPLPVWELDKLFP